MSEERAVFYDGREIRYLLERKPVRNLNLRIHRDCRVYVSADPEIPAEIVDAFVMSKGEYIHAAQKQFRDTERYAPQPRQYVSGETFYLLGRGVRLKVEKGERETIFSDGIYLRLSVRDPDDFTEKEKMVTGYVNELCRSVFGEVISEVYPVFQKYGVAMPALRIRDMETRWGSCLSKKGIITLNKRLIEAPRNCIEYVVTHEFCHFIYANHSKPFYDFLTMLMPDWRERKAVLDHSAAFGI